MIGKEIRFPVFYGTKEKTHHFYDEGWTHLALFCLHCGKQAVWQAASGDMYAGEQMICTSCSHTWTLPTLPYKIESLRAESVELDQNNQRLDSLRYER